MKGSINQQQMTLVSGWNNKNVNTKCLKELVTPYKPPSLVHIQNIHKPPARILKLNE